MTNDISRVHAAGSLAIAWMLAVGVAAQTPPEQKPVPSVKEVSARPILSIAGKDNFDAYCAVCHGKDGKGDGPAAPAMKAALPDLTTMAKRNNGRFDAARVEYIVRGTGKTATPAHGVEHMPIWGDVFRSEDQARARLRIGNLVRYVESIQAGAGTDSAPR
jgi:mono/diheme cytochrome c family protein